MPRIPYEGLPSVAPSGQGAPSPHNVAIGGYDSLTRGAQQLGQGVGNQLEKAANEYDKGVEESRKKALEAEVTEGDSAWSQYRTERKYGRRSSGSASQDAGDAAFGDTETAGYFNTNGDEAFKAAPDTFSSIEKRRKEIADEMSDDEAKQLFLKRTADQLEGDRAQIESYAGKQRQLADVATLKAREEVALEAIRANPNDFVEVSKQIAALDEPHKRLGLSDADRQDRVDDWRRRAAVAQTMAQLNNPELGGWEAAEKTLESKRNTIGAEAAEKLEKQINSAKGDAGAEVKARDIVAQSSRPSGLVNMDEALKLVDQLPPGKEADEVRQRVHQRAVEQQHIYNAGTSEIGRRAYESYNDVGWSGIPAPLKEQLNERDPRLYHALKEDSQQRWRMVQGSKSDRAKAQEAYDREALKDYRLSADGASERSKLPLEEFLRLYPSLSKEGRQNIELQAQGDRNVVRKGAGVSEAEFLRRGKEWGQASIKDKKKREDELARSYVDLMGPKGEEVPDEQAVKGKLTSLQSNVIRKGWIFDSKEYGYEARRRRREEESKAAQGAQVLPELDFTQQTRPTVGERAKQLAAEKKTRAEAAQILKQEGY
jgi:hypothetical protein